MAILAGIGRALTSVGSDLQRNRLEREEREQRFADLKESRVYAEDVRDEQARIRAAETQANRDWSIRQQATQNLYAEGVTQAQRAWTDARDIRLTEETVARTAAQNQVLAAGRAETNRLADARQQRGFDRTDEHWEDATTAAHNLRTRGRPLSEVTVLALPGTGAVYSPGGSPEEDEMALHRVGAPLPTTGQPSAGQANAVRRNVAAAGEIVHPEEGWVTGFQYSPYEIERRSQEILQGRDPGGWNQGVPEPTFEPELIDTPGFRGWAQRTLPWGETGSEISTPPPSTAMAPQEGAGQRQRIGAGGEVAPPGIDPEEYRRMLDSGATPEMIQRWIAREAARGGR